MQQGLMTTLHETTTHVCQQDVSSAKLALLRGLAMLRGTSGEDPQISAMADMPLRRRILRLLEECSTEVDTSTGFCDAWKRRDILGAALRGDWALAVQMMVEVLENCRGSSSSDFGVDVRTGCTPHGQGLRRRDCLGGS